MKIDSNPTFPLQSDDGELKIVSEYQQKYIAISNILDTNQAVLDAAHGDLQEWGSNDVAMVLVGDAGFQ